MPITSVKGKSNAGLKKMVQKEMKQAKPKVMKQMKNMKSGKGC